MSDFSDLLLSKNLGIYLPQDATNGATDQSGNGNDGTGEGSINIGGFADGPPILGEDDTSTDYNGTTQRITTNYLPYVNGTTRTFMGWAWRDSLSGSRALFGGLAATTFPFFRVDDGVATLRFDADESGASALWAGAWPGIEQWVFWGLVFREAADTVSLYINGALVSTQAQTVPYSAGPGNLVWGSYDVPAAGRWDGKKAHDAVVEGEVTEEEFAQLYDYAINGAPTPVFISTTPSLAEVISSSHDVITKVAPVDDPENFLPLVDGTVNLEANVVTRGRCDLVFNDPALIPMSPGDILAPFGQQLQVWRGVLHPDGEDTIVSLGKFRIEDINVRDEEGIHIDVALLDRSAIVIDDTFAEPYQIVGGTDYLTAIQDTLSASDPTFEFNFPDLTMSCPTTIAEEGDNRWEFCQDMAAAIGHELFFDREGILVLRAIPALTIPSNVDHFHIHEGNGGILLGAEKDWSRSEAGNRWTVTGENTGEGDPVRGEAIDDDPNSPTFYGGPFGKVNKRESYEFITTAEQAEAAAAGLLEQSRGIGQSVSFDMIPNPTLEPGDIVHIERTTLGLVEEHVLETISIPLGFGGEMSGTTRKTRVT